MAISSPLLETAIDGAKGVIINITSSPDIGLDEIDNASSMITEQAHSDANIIWGAAFDENMEDEMSVTVIATGFATHNGASAPEAAAPAPAAPAKPQQQSSAPASRPASSTSPRAQANPVAEDDDGGFTDIMSIFNRY